jgi:hypothetical protein
MGGGENMPKYCVVTPEYGTKIPILDDGSGPIEYGCDVIEIEADNKRDAIAMGVKEMLKGGYGGHGRSMDYQWCRDQRKDNCSPYTGVTAELSNAPCVHCEGTGCSGAHPHEPCGACQGTGIDNPI